MNYLLLIWADGMPAPEHLAVMQRELPGWEEEMTRRGVRLHGRELDLPHTSATVRVRAGETLVTDGPFAETKEFIAGFDLLQCGDLNEAIEIAALCPISQFQPLEIRPFGEGLRLDERASAFACQDDPPGTAAYLLSSWVDPAAAASFDDRALSDEYEMWRRDQEARGVHVLGNVLGSPGAATTVRVRDGETVLTDGPFTNLDEFLASIDVVSCTDRREAIALAAAHPIALHHAIEVRPFYVG